MWSGKGGDHFISSTAVSMGMKVRALAQGSTPVHHLPGAEEISAAGLTWAVIGSCGRVKGCRKSDITDLVIFNNLAFTAENKAACLADDQGDKTPGFPQVGRVTYTSLPSCFCRTRPLGPHLERSLEILQNSDFTSEWQWFSQLLQLHLNSLSIHLAFRNLFFFFCEPPLPTLY